MGEAEDRTTRPGRRNSEELGGLRDGTNTHVTQLRSLRFGGKTLEMEDGDDLVFPSLGQSSQHMAASGDPGWLMKTRRRQSRPLCPLLTLKTTTILHPVYFSSTDTGTRSPLQLGKLSEISEGTSLTL